MMKLLMNLKKYGFNHLNNKKYFSDYFISDSRSKQVLEGSKIETVISRYERNPHARQICLNEHGYDCAVCGFNFEKIYGNFGKDFIHVHHLNPLSEINKVHELNPINNLIPICPNCHSMIHLKRPAMKINELKAIINKIK